MSARDRDDSSRQRRAWLLHSARTAVGAASSLAVARLLGTPEAYWAPVTTLVVMQSTLGAAWTVSKQRLVGTVLGAALGGVLATWFAPSVLVFGVGVALLGFPCAWLQLDRSAYRFAGITLAIVTLAGHDRPPATLALHRFIEVAVGIVVALVVTTVWPSNELSAGAAAVTPRR